MANLVYSIIWLLVLIFIAFFVAGFASFFYIILLPFTVCVEPLTGLCDLLLKCIQFPKYCAQGFMEGKPLA